MKLIPTLFLSLFVMVILAGCSNNPSSNDPATTNTTTLTLLDTPEQTETTLNNLQVQWTKIYAEDELVYSDQIQGYGSGDVDVINIKSGGDSFREAIRFKNPQAIKTLTQEMLSSNCEFKNESKKMRSVPNTTFQAQIDLIVLKVTQSGQSSLSTQEDRVYSNMMDLCPYAQGEFTINGSTLIWYRNPKNGGGNSSYINRIIPQS